MIRRWSLLLLFTFEFVGSGFTETFPVENVDLYTKQMKLLISNDYRELMTVYDPIWLAHLWPKLRNGVHLQLDKYCWMNLTVFFQDMLDGHAWTLGAVDSSGSFASGLLWGNRYWIGSQEECDDLTKRYIDFISNSSSSALTHMKYVSSLSRNIENTGSKQSRRDSINPILLSKMILLDNTPPFEMKFSAVTICLNITKTTLYSTHTIMMGICLPQICNGDDIKELLDFSIKTYQNLRVSGTLPRTAKVINVRSLNGSIHILKELKFLIIGLIVAVFVVMVIIGTLVDIASKSAMGSDLRDTPPTFKSFLQIESIDSLAKDKTYEIPRRMKISNDNLVQPQKSLESFHTIDGLIPNRYTETVSDFHFPENEENCNKTKMNLVTVKKITKSNDSPSITLDVMTIKDDEHPVNYVDGDVKKNYEDSSVILKFVNGFRSLDSFDAFHGIDRDSFFSKMLICFSIRTNFNKIFSVDIGEDTLSPIHGIKFLSILWVVLVHTALVIFQLSDNKVYRGKVEMNFLYQIIGNGTYSVDTFFVLSGVLISYLYCQTMKRCSASNNSMDISGAIGKLVQFFTAITYRYLRLTPPYLMAIVFAEYSSKYFNSNNILELPGRDHENCERHWWRNALYINTFYPLEEMCMSWSWYLSNDTQFYIIGIVLLILSVKHIKTSATLFICLLLVGWITTAMVTLKTGYIPSIEDPLLHYNELYNKPWTRIGPYLVGIFTGWYLSKTSCCLLISKKLSAMLWLISFLLLFGVVFGLYGIELEKYSSIAYTSLSHTSWGIAISWILVACVTGYGGAVDSILSCRFIYPLSRLSYCLYLIHPIMLKAIFISSGSVQHVSLEMIGLFYTGFVIFGFICALIFSLLFEAPIVSLLKLMNPLRRSTGSYS